MSNTSDDPKPEFDDLMEQLDTKGGVGISTNDIHLEVNENAKNIFGLVRRWISEIKGKETLPGQQIGYLVTEISLSYSKKYTVSVHPERNKLDGVGIHIKIDLETRKVEVTERQANRVCEYTFEEIRSRREFTQRVVSEGDTVVYRTQNGEVEEGKVNRSLQNAINISQEAHPIPYANIIELK